MCNVKATSFRGFTTNNWQAHWRSEPVQMNVSSADSCAVWERALRSPPLSLNAPALLFIKSRIQKLSELI